MESSTKNARNHKGCDEYSYHFLCRAAPARVFSVFVKEAKHTTVQPITGLCALYLRICCILFLSATILYMHVLKFQYQASSF